MKRIKIAQIGTSMYSHGFNAFETIRKQSDLYDVIGYCFPENEMKRYKDYENFDEYIKIFDGAKELTLDEILNNPEIEAVTVETEEKYLTKYAYLAAKHGKHIHMEKPGSTDLKEFLKLIDTVKENKTVFHTGYMYRYNPCVMDIMRQIKAGEFGKILSVEAQMNCSHKKQVREWLDGFPGGMMFFLGCHLVDLVLQIKGFPEKVIPFNFSTNLDNVKSQDFGMAVFQYSDGASFIKAHDTEIGGFARRQLVVVGEKKTVELKPLEMFTDGNGGTELYTGVTEYLSKNWGDVGKKYNSAPFDRYDTMMKSFAAMVCGEKENPWNYDYELELYKTVLKACGVEF